MKTFTPRPNFRTNLLFLGLTAIFIGYFLVWLPGPGAGLKLIGIEIGEWIKFLGVGGRRNLFYLPPIILGLLLALLTAGWPNDRRQTWLMRGLAVGVSLLAFPALAAIRFEPGSEWLLRLVMIGLVILAVIFSSLAAGFPHMRRWIWLSMAIIALIGIILPTIQYLAVRPVVAGILRQPVGIGVGVWLNVLGGVFVVVVAVANFLAYDRD